MVLSARNTRNGMWCGCLNQRICLKLYAPIYVEKSGVLNLLRQPLLVFWKISRIQAVLQLKFLMLNHWFHLWVILTTHELIVKIFWTHIQPIFAQTPKISKNTIDGYIIKILLMVIYPIKYPQKLHRFLPHLSTTKIFYKPFTWWSV